MNEKEKKMELHTALFDTYRSEKKKMDLQFYNEELIKEAVEFVKKSEDEEAVTSTRFYIKEILLMRRKKVQNIAFLLALEKNAVIDKKNMTQKEKEIMEKIAKILPEGLEILNGDIKNGS